MINIRPVSDLRNKFPELEETVMESNEPVFLTKNGYGTMVLLSIEQYSALTDDTERKLDEADAAAAKSDERYSADEVFTRVRMNEIVDYISTDLHNPSAADRLVDAIIHSFAFPLYKY